MKLILEELAYIDALDAFKPPLYLLDTVRDHTTEIINELSTQTWKQVKPLESSQTINESRRLCPTHLPPSSESMSVLHDLSNIDNIKPKRLTKFVPLSH